MATNSIQAVPNQTDTFTLWLCQQFAIENDPVEIVDFPIKPGDFP